MIFFLMLEPFHTLMNFWEEVGTLKNGSGLSEVLQEIYRSNTGWKSSFKSNKWSNYRRCRTE